MIFLGETCTCHFQGTVTIVLGENPASAALGGFKQSASAFRYCCHCLGTEDDIQSKVCFCVQVCIVNWLDV